jgi:two-component system nitrate/nitrite response regulator NarL
MSGLWHHCLIGVVEMIQTVQRCPAMESVGEIEAGSPITSQGLYEVEEIVRKESERRLNMESRRGDHQKELVMSVETLVSKDEARKSRFSSPNRTRILIASCQSLFRSGLQKSLEDSHNLCVVGEARDANETLILMRQLRPDVLVLDQNLTPSAEFVLEDLEQYGPASQIIILRDECDQPWIEDFVVRGAGKITSSGSDFSELLGVLTNAAAVRVTTPPSVPRTTAPMTAERPAVAPAPTETVINDEVQIDPVAVVRLPFGLTPRELQVIGAIVEGQTNKDIAETFSISQFTVKHHLTRIFDKVGVFNRLELALFAVNHNLADLVNPTKSSTSTRSSIRPATPALLG